MYVVTIMQVLYTEPTTSQCAITYIELHIEAAEEVIDTAAAACAGRLGHLLEEPTQPLDALNLVELLGGLDDGELVVVVPDVQVQTVRLHVLQVTGKETDGISMFIHLRF